MRHIPTHVALNASIQMLYVTAQETHRNHMHYSVL